MLRYVIWPRWLLQCQMSSCWDYVSWPSWPLQCQMTSWWEMLSDQGDYVIMLRYVVWPSLLLQSWMSSWCEMLYCQVNFFEVRCHHGMKCDLAKSTSSKKHVLGTCLMFSWDIWYVTKLTFKLIGSLTSLGKIAISPVYNIQIGWNKRHSKAKTSFVTLTYVSFPLDFYLHQARAFFRCTTFSRTPCRYLLAMP